MGSAAIALELPPGGQFRDLASSPVDDTWYVLSLYGGIFRSTDAGASWTACGPSPANGVEVAQNGDVFVSSVQGVYRSTDRCASFSNVNAPTATLAIGVAGPTTYGLGDNQLWRFNAPGDWPQVVTPLDGSYYTAFHASPTLRIVGGWDTGVAVSTDGTSWTVKTTGFNGLRVKDVAVGTARSYVLTEADGVSNGGVSCSDGTGATWTSCLTAGGTALAVDPADDQHVVVAQYDSLGETGNAFAVYVTGVRAASGLDDAIVRDLHYTSGGTLLLASDRGVFASTTRPLVFQPKLNGLTVWTIDAIVRDGDDVFLGTEAGVLRSNRGGPFTLSTQGQQFNTQVWRLGVAADGTVIGPGRFIWGSRDRGSTWEALVPLGAADGYYAHVVHFIGERAFVGTKTRVHRADPPYTSWQAAAIAGEVYGLAHVGVKLFAATSQGAYVSSDGGLSFTAEITGVACVDVAAFTDDRVVFACDDGVWTSDDTTTHADWTQRLPGENLHALAAIDDDRMAVLGTDDGAYVTTDRGTTWTPVSSPTGVRLQSAIYDPGDGSLVLGTSGHGLLRVALPD